MSSIVGLYAFVIASAFSAPQVIDIYQSLIGRQLEFNLAFMFLTLKELGIGVLLGVVLAFPFWAIQAAGDVIDHTRGASMGNTIDPINSSETTTSGSLFLIVALLYFAASGGLLQLIEIVHESFKVWPLKEATPEFDVQLASYLGGFLTAVGEVAFLIGAPILLSMLAIDLALMLLGRMAGQLQISDLSNTFKNVALVFLIPVFMLFFGRYFDLIDARIPAMFELFTGGKLGG